MEDSIKANDKVIRLYEEFISATYPYLKNMLNCRKLYWLISVSMVQELEKIQKLLVVIMMNYEKLCLIQNLIRLKKILDFVESGNFANNEVISVVLHEAGHKYYYDSIRKLVEKSGIK